MPKRGLRLNTEDYNQIVEHRCLAKKRKDLYSRVRLRSILLVHEGNTLGQVGQILEVARSTIERWIKRYRGFRRNGLACARTVPRQKAEVKSGPEKGTCHHGSTRS
jgi:hypothetical protein